MKSYSCSNINHNNVSNMYNRFLPEKGNAILKYVYKCLSITIWKEREWRKYCEAEIGEKSVIVKSSRQMRYRTFGGNISPQIETILNWSERERGAGGRHRQKPTKREPGMPVVKLAGEVFSIKSERNIEETNHHHHMLRKRRKQEDRRKRKHEIEILSNESK